MALRQYTQFANRLGSPKSMAPGGSDGRMTLLHGGMGTGVPGGLNPLGTPRSAVSQSPMGSVATVGRVGNRIGGSENGSEAPQNTSQGQRGGVSSGKKAKPFSGKYQDSIYDRNIAELVHTLESTLGDLNYQKLSAGNEYTKSQRDMSREAGIALQRANAAAGLMGGGGDSTTMPTILQNTNALADLVAEWQKIQKENIRQISLAKKGYNKRKLAEQGLAKERYKMMNG